tara:strand:- start:457 stop:738 length:282 start_codon:yes stop_codon:yes gene_type:complete
LFELLIIVSVYFIEPCIDTVSIIVFPKTKSGSALTSSTYTSPGQERFERGCPFLVRDSETVLIALAEFLAKSSSSLYFTNRSHQGTKILLVSR